MWVRLLKDVIENGVVKTARREGRRNVEFAEGAVVHMSDASARKYIERGLAEETDGPADTERDRPAAPPEAGGRAGGNRRR